MKTLLPLSVFLHFIFPLAFISLFIYTPEMNAQKISTECAPFTSSGYQFYHGDQKIKERDLSPIMAHNPSAYKHWQKYRTYKHVAQVSAGVGLVAAVWLAFSIDIGPYESNYDPHAYALLLGATSADLTFRFMSHIQRNKAVSIYNEGIDISHSTSMIVNSNGLGIAFRF